MNCEDFEMLMADALGDELSPADRATFEVHLATCTRCRDDYETSNNAVEAMRSLPGPQNVCVERKGDRLVIRETHTRGVPPDPRRESERAGRRALHRSLALPARFGSVLRYAASILIAFTAGYAFHAGLMLTDAGGRSGSISLHVGASTASLRGSLASVHARKPSRSSLAKCLVAIAPGRSGRFTD